MASFAWTPDEHTQERAQLTKFLEFSGVPSIAELYQRSIDDVAWFTEQVLRFLRISFHRPYENILDLTRGDAWPQWCVGGGLNISTSCLEGHPLDQPAVVWEAEEGRVRTLTYGELGTEVKACARGLRALGIGRGDAIAIHLPMMPETVISLLAAAQIGAVAVPLFSGYGPAAIEARLQDVNAKIVITCDSFPRRGKLSQGYDVVRQATSRCPTVEQIIVVERSGAARADSGMAWNTLVSSAEDSAEYTEATDADDTLMILYTSGTTGRAKGIVHTHCGFPVKAAQDMCFGTDVGPGTRISWVTDIGWMMGPWLLYGALILGATIVLYDGAPDYPDAGRLWQFCERHRVEVLGLSPTLVRAVAVQGDDVPGRSDLSSLRIFASTGEPWNPDPWWWLFDVVGKQRIPIINYSGGTEISGGILMGNPLLPMKPCSFATPCLGIAADIVDENGESVGANSVGELVIRKPWIGIARGFWQDPSRYLETYWSRWPGLWTHGDWAERDLDGHWYILGRSDDTLKIAGKRVGPAEVESVLVSHPNVVEAAVIGSPHKVKGECMVAFCVLVPGKQATPELAGDLKNLVAAEMGKPLRPETLHFVAALPKTRNGKVMRRVIKATYLAQEAGDLSALENLDTIEMIRSTRQ